MKRLVLLLLLALPLHAERYQGPVRRNVVEREASRLRGTHDDAYPDRAPIRLSSDNYTLSTANRPGAGGFTPAGAWADGYTQNGMPLSRTEANLLGDIAVRYVLNSPDRVNLPVLTRDGTMLMIRSDALGRAVFTHKTGYVGMVDLRTFPKPETARFRFETERLWTSRPNAPPTAPGLLQRIQNYFVPARTPANKYGTYDIKNPSTFTRSTAEEVKLSVLSSDVPPERATVLRRQGFVPIDEVAGGTPWYPSNVDGWVMPLRDGVKTFPESD